MYTHNWKVDIGLRTSIDNTIYRNPAFQLVMLSDRTTRCYTNVPCLKGCQARWGKCGLVVRQSEASSIQLNP